MVSKASQHILTVFILLLTTGASLRLSPEGSSVDSLRLNAVSKDTVDSRHATGSNLMDPRASVIKFNNGYWEPSTKSHKSGPLRYEWKLHNGLMEDFDEELFCKLDTGNILFVGDSSSVDHFLEFLEEFENKKEASPADWLPKNEDPTWRGYSSFKVCENNRTIAFIKNYLLDTAPHHENMAWSCDNDSCSGTWANNEIINNFGTLVINTGAHWHEYKDGRKLEDYTSRIEAAVNFLKPYHHLKTFFRTSVPGFANCSDHENEPPFTNLGEAEKFIQNNTFWDHPSFKAKNDIAINAFTKAGFSILDAYTPSILRLDGHVSSNDCLHYVRPGPMPHWDRLLFNLMLLHYA